MKTDDVIFVAGGRGLVGSAIIRRLEKAGYTNILAPTSKELDLRDQSDVQSYFALNKIDYVFDAAARVGGIYANDTYSGEFIYENLMIQTNLIDAAYTCGVKKFLFLGSVCIYPKFAPTPVKEDSLMTGFLEPTNDAYAVAKISGIKMLQAYYKQYGFNSVSLMPSNLYGPGDNFHPDNGHVIPAMMTKFARGDDTVTLWGDGTPTREFLYVDDLADACFFAMITCGGAEIYNVGSGIDVSIADLSVEVAEVTNYTGKIVWDTDRPNGTPKRPLDCSKFYHLGWKPKTSLKDGLKKTYDWYKFHKSLQQDIVITETAEALQTK
jgi:GDP-L-fucose synthase|tara:strand:+ start:2474 stop:3442 length:969 start_codon:yes stop_codon:yes gene_type:complete